MATAAAAGAAKPALTSFDFTQIDRWMSDLSDNHDPESGKIEETRQKVIQVAKDLGVTNGELFPALCHFENLANKSGDHSSTLAGQLVTLASKLNSIFQIAVSQKNNIHLPPVDHQTFHMLRQAIVKLKINPEDLDTVREKTLKALKEAKFVSEKELQDIERRFLIIKDKQISEQDVVIECNCLIGRLRTIFYHRGYSEVPREPSEEAQALIVKLLPVLKSCDFDGVQKLIDTTPIDDLDFPFNQLSFENYKVINEFNRYREFSSDDILSFAIHYDNVWAISILLHRFAFDVTDAHIISTHAESIWGQAESLPQIVSELLTRLIPLTYWKHRRIDEYLSGKVFTKLLCTHSEFMSLLIDANISPQTFVRHDFDSLRLQVTLGMVKANDSPQTDKYNVWKQALYYGAEFRYHSVHEKAMVIADTIPKMYLLSMKYRVQDTFVDHSFMPRLTTLLNRHFNQIKGITSIVLQFLPTTLRDMPPKDRHLLHDYCITVAKVYNSAYIPSCAEINAVIVTLEHGNKSQQTQSWWSNCTIS